jgi:hypothetical protein
LLAEIKFKEQKKIPNGPNNGFNHRLGPCLSSSFIVDVEAKQRFQPSFGPLVCHRWSSWSLRPKVEVMVVVVDEEDKGGNQHDHVK